MQPTEKGRTTSLSILSLICSSIARERNKKKENVVAEEM
jgi:hypothetical protein